MSKNTTQLTASERKDLEAVGWSEASPFDIPENVSPVLKSKVVEAYKKEQGLVSPLDMPSAIESGNQMARARAADNGDKDMQVYLSDAEKNATAKDADAAKTAGAGRQGDAVNKN